MSATAPTQETIETIRASLITETDRALLVFVARPGEGIIGDAAWIPIARITQARRLGEPPGDVELRVRGPVEWRPARRTASNKVVPIAPMAKRIPPNPIAPWPRHSRPSAPAGMPTPSAEFGEALASATIERVGPSVEELLARHAKRGIVVQRGERGWAVRAVVGSTDEGYVRTTVALEGATLLEALEALDGAVREHAFARTAHRARVTGGRR